MQCRTPIMIVCLLFGLCLGSCGVQAQQQDVVATVSVRILSDSPIPAKVEKRMVSSVQSVGEHLLLGQDVEEVRTRKSSTELTVKDVFDRVFIGYVVDAVTVHPGIDTQVEVALHPAGELIEHTQVDVQVSNASSWMRQLIDTDLRDFPGRVRQLLTGLPVESFDWAETVSRNLLRQTLSALLPEYEAQVDFDPGRRTTVHVTLYPLGPVIRDTDLTLRSRSVPNLLLLDMKLPLNQQLSALVGVPVNFVVRHQAVVEQVLTQSAQQSGDARRYGLNIHSVLTPQDSTMLVMDVEAQGYRLSVEGYYNMGSLNDNTELRLHAGKIMSNHYELFAETRVDPQSMTWKYYPGIAIQVVPATELGWRYNVNDHEHTLWVWQKVRRDFSFRLERNFSEKTYEAGLIYRLNGFVSAELMRDQRETWVRLMGRL